MADVYLKTQGLSPRLTVPAYEIAGFPSHFCKTKACLSDEIDVSNFDNWWCLFVHPARRVAAQCDEAHRGRIASLDEEEEARCVFDVASVRSADG